MDGFSSSAFSDGLDQVVNQSVGRFVFSCGCQHVEKRRAPFETILYGSLERYSNVAIAADSLRLRLPIDLGEQRVWEMDGGWHEYIVNIFAARVKSLPFTGLRL
jgi:hypothetical protein